LAFQAADYVKAATSINPSVLLLPCVRLLAGWAAPQGKGKITERLEYDVFGLQSGSYRITECRTSDHDFCHEPITCTEYAKPN
jgi:hypothetical protein